VEIFKSLVYKAQINNEDMLHHFLLFVKSFAITRDSLKERQSIIRRIIRPCVLNQMVV